MSFNPIPGMVKYTRDTKNSWEITNPILPLNVFCFEINGSEVKLKIGDGINRWNSTPYFTNQPSLLADLSTLGLISKSTLSEVIEGIDTNKYITSAQLLTRLNSLIGGDILTLSPGSVIYRAVDDETYITNGDYPALRPYGSPEPERGGLIPDIAFRMEHKGSCTLYYQQRKGLGNTYIRIAKNLEVISEQPAQSSSYRTYTQNISFIPGDIIQIQGRDASSSWSGRVRNVRLLVANIP